MGGKCCSDRKPDKKENEHSAGHASTEQRPLTAVHLEHVEPEYEVDHVLQARAQMKDDEALNVHSQLHGYIGSDGIVIGVLGEAVIQSERTKAILMAIGGMLARDFKGRAVFLTCGYGEEGVQAVFSEACSIADPLAVFDIQPRGMQDPLSTAQMIVAGNDVDHMLQIYAQVCDVYITAEGADLVTEAAMLCAYWGAVIVPLISTGGASSGEYHFPSGCLTAPPCVPEALWSVLGHKEMTPQAMAQGVGRIFETLIVARKAAVEIHKKVASKAWGVAATKVMSGAKEKVFDAHKITSKEEAKHMEDLDFEAVLNAWKPKGGAVRSNIDIGGGATNGEPPKVSEAPKGPPPAVTRDAVNVKIAAPPPRPDEDDSHDKAVDEIAEMRKRMAAKLEEVHKKTDKASTKVQAVFRGKMARKVVTQLKEQMKKEGLAAALHTQGHGAGATDKKDHPAAPAAAVTPVKSETAKDHPAAPAAAVTPVKDETAKEPPAEKEPAAA